MNTYTATLAQVLSVTTGRLVCEMGALYEILNAITGDNLYTHVLPRAARFAKPILHAKYPKLWRAEAREVDLRLSEMIDNAKALPGDVQANCGEAVKAWLDWMRGPAVCDLPESFEIDCHSATWLSFDPIEELEMLTTKGVITVAAP